MLTPNQIALSKALAKTLVDIESIIPGATGEWSQQLTADIAEAETAAAGAKATPVQIVSDAFVVASAIGTEVGNPAVEAFINDLEATEQDAVNEKFGALVLDFIKDYKAAKAL